MTPPAVVPPDRIYHSFRRALASYHNAAVAQARIATLLIDALQTAGAPADFGSVLEFGCGTGLLTAEMLGRLGIGDLLLNDLVAASADAVDRVTQGHKARVTFQAGAIETLPLPPGLDLIASASTVQWVADPAALIGRLAAHHAPGGWLAISGFGRDHFPELRAFGQQAQAPSCLDPRDWAALMPACLQIRTVRQHSIALPFVDAISLLRHLRLTGVNAGPHRHWTRANLADFDRRVRDLSPDPAHLTLTYRPVIVIAQKAAG